MRGIALETTPASKARHRRGAGEREEDVRDDIPFDNDDGLLPGPGGLLPQRRQ